MRGSRTSASGSGLRDIEAAVETVRQAGGKILERRKFVPDETSVYVADLDAYTIEIWYERSAGRYTDTGPRRGSYRRNPIDPRGDPP